MNHLTQIYFITSLLQNIKLFIQLFKKVLPDLL